MISVVKQGIFLPSAWGASDFSEVANAINKASGSVGVTVGRNSDGGIKVELGDDSYQFRDVTICEHTTTGDGRPALAFKRIKVLCTNPSEPFLVIPVADANGTVGADTDCARPIFAEGVLTQIIFGKSSAFAAYDADNEVIDDLEFVDVAPCDSGGVE